jgi:hypothetical protein
MGDFHGLSPMATRSATVDATDAATRGSPRAPQRDRASGGPTAHRTQPALEPRSTRSATVGVATDGSVVGGCVRRGGSGCRWRCGRRRWLGSTRSLGRARRPRSPGRGPARSASCPPDRHRSGLVGGGGHPASPSAARRSGPAPPPRRVLPGGAQHRHLRARGDHRLAGRRPPLTPTRGPRSPSAGQTARRRIACDPRSRRSTRGGVADAWPGGARGPAGVSGRLA